MDRIGNNREMRKERRNRKDLKEREIMRRRKLLLEFILFSTLSSRCYNPKISSHYYYINISI
jgi:hypothetical protein